MMKRVLVPLDGSELAESVLLRLPPLFRRGGTEITLVAALPPTPEADFIRTAMTKEDVRAVQRYLRRIAEKLEKREATKLSVSTRAEIGPAAETILDVADDVDSSLICMSTHGRSGIRRVLYGSVTDKVVRASTRPVLVIPSFDRTEPEGGVDRREWAFRSIVVPLDGSRQALQILPQVVDVAGTFGSKVTLLIVLHEGADETFTKAADEHLAAATQLFERAGISTSNEIRTGDAANEILDYTPRYDHDMIMMTTHGRSGVSRWMLGSVAAKIVRRATVPVLVVRSTPITDPA